MSVEDNLPLGAFDRYRRGDRDFATTMNEVYGIFPACVNAPARWRHPLRRRAADAGDGRALMAKPKLLMLDEPSLGLAPLIIREIFRIVSGLREMGVSVLLVEQNARAALQVADFGYVLETGEISSKAPAGACQ